MKKLIKSLKPSKLGHFIHILIWLIFFLIPLVFLNQAEDFYFFKLLERWIRILFFIIIFYINYLVFTPKLFFKNRKAIYFVSLLLLISATTLIWIEITDLYFSIKFQHFIDESVKLKEETEQIIKNHNPRQFIIINQIITSILVCGLASIIRISEKWYFEAQKQKELESELLNAKLEFLKHQISPHFFLNTLNNIYSLTEINVEDARKAIHKLSKLMRYLLYDSEKGETDINSEIEFINSYIELMKLRFTDEIIVLFDIQSNIRNYKISPLLFISFIENAFKHGVSYENKSFVKIEIAQTEKYLIFRCQNSNHAKDSKIITTSGIGLENVKTRLDLIYKSDYKFNISDNDAIFLVELQIPLEM